MSLVLTRTFLGLAARGEKKAHATGWGQLLHGEKPEKHLSKNQEYPQKEETPIKKYIYNGKKEEEKAFILTERRKTGNSLPTKIPLNERSGRIPRNFEPF